MSETDISERDRIATELQYVTRTHDWAPGPACLDAIISWHLQSLATARSESWLPGAAEKLDPLTERALLRVQQHQFSRIVNRRINENAKLKLKLLMACDCIEFYADGAYDSGVRATQALKALLSEAVQPVEHVLALERDDSEVATRKRA